jgi:predicted AlkP superfamily phosphohydrolase/phosphomutase
MPRKVIVVGLDGFEPSIVERLLRSRELPSLKAVSERGGYSRLRTTFPAQTPVAWSTFATGVNPGGHGIFDFVRRDPRTYLPDISMTRYEQKNAFLPPKAVNLRRGAPMWDALAAAGIPSTIVRCPCTYPPDNMRGRMLAGMGVPDLRGGLGTSTFYTSEAYVKAKESENVVHVTLDPSGAGRAHLIGPRNPKTKSDIQFELSLKLDPAAKKLTVRSDGQPSTLVIREGEWSDWLRVKFKLGLLQSVRGMVRFYFVQSEPTFELYASPVNFDPDSPLFPISHPPEYAKELARDVGTFYTTGMVEDHGGLNNGRFGEEAYLAQCEDVLRERERMMLHELKRFNEGLFFCLFDTPDRLAHMFWRFGEPDHPANRGSASSGLERVIEEHYRKCDEVVGRALAHADGDTLVVVLSDHGMNSFQRGMHLNTWLYDMGLLALQNGARPGDDAGEFFKTVDWDRTKAYALGLGSLYLNVKGREERGIVEGSDVATLKAVIARELGGFVDPVTGVPAVTRVVAREEVYSGAYADEAPDMLVNFNSGYRVSWATALGGVPEGHFEDNVKKWAGDHLIDPSLVPGVLFMNRQFGGDPELASLAPTILDFLGVPRPGAMERDSLLRDSTSD